MQADVASALQSMQTSIMILRGFLEVLSSPAIGLNQNVFQVLASIETSGPNAAIPQVHLPGSGRQKNAPSKGCCLGIMSFRFWWAQKCASD